MYIYIYILCIYIYDIYMKLWAGYADQPSDFRGPNFGETSCFNWSDSIDVPTRLISGIVFPLFLCPQSVTLW